MAGGPESVPPEGPTANGSLARHLCQVGGRNENYLSRAGTLYHIQIEDRGPVADPVLARQVRRVNVIVYANYGEPNARIIFGRDYDFEDVRSQAHNRFIEGRIAQLSQEAREVVEQQETRRVERVKATIREYHRTKADEAKKALEEANAFFPFVFSRAWMELKQEKGRGAAPAEPVGEPKALDPSPAATGEELAPPEMIYPLDPALRERVLEIERMLDELHRDLERLRERGSADDILLQTCRKLITRARESITSREVTDFNTKRLEMTRNSLATTWRQVQSRLR
jgi:hypothetical protein